MGKLIDIKELSDQLGLAAQTIYRRRSERADLPAAIKIGGSIRWRQETVDAWLVKNEGKLAA